MSVIPIDVAGALGSREPEPIQLWDAWLFAEAGTVLAMRLGVLPGRRGEFRLAAMWARSSGAMLSPMGVTCLIVDDSVRFLELASSLLERHGIEVVGTASSTAQALSRAAELRPDVVLVDIDLGGESGFELTRDLTTAEHARVILVSSHAEVDFADLIEASPALGFIPKAELSAQAVYDLVGSDPKRQTPR
ncbi:MAG: hypothetical protein QOF55_1795 [Thermoleophilaceae bacterium]|nr:hypothetical protein [Solirubrobacteraceae bacterium]MEA2422696.1 hypothetical protein [Thermoleophilaceae bacterium]